MKIENAIEVKNIRKSFKVYLDKGHTLKEKALFKARNRYEERQVLKGISFDVKKGEAIGLIGHNGCGKSTTLKLLTKIIYPDSGSIEMRGRVSSLIELGAGFHPDMSGRENIYTNAAIFGLTKKEIDRRINSIIEFSELEEFIDNPVRTYSSGMYMRLAFSVAINVDADILLIDEILAVGDMSFQAKCFRRLREIKKEGTTIVIVSHSMNQIEEICDRTIWIDKGLIREEGKPRSVNRNYMMFMSGYTMGADSKSEDVEEDEVEEVEEVKKEEKEEKKEENTFVDPFSARTNKNEEEISIFDVRMLGEDGKKRNSFATGEKVTVTFKYKVKNLEHEKNSIELLILRAGDGVEIYETNTFREGFELMYLEGQGTIKIEIEKLNLVTGDYYLELAIRKPDAFPFCYLEKAYEFHTMSLENERGIAKIDHSWDFGEVRVDER